MSRRPAGASGSAGCWGGCAGHGGALRFTEVVQVRRQRLGIVSPMVGVVGQDRRQGPAEQSRLDTYSGAGACQLAPLLAEASERDRGSEPRVVPTPLAAAYSDGFWGWTCSTTPTSQAQESASFFGRCAVTTASGEPSRSVSSGCCQPNRRAIDSHRSSCRRRSAGAGPTRAPSETTCHGTAGRA